MKTKLMLRSSLGVLFFMLLFSKPYIARCQTAPVDNHKNIKEVRMQLRNMTHAFAIANAS